MPFSSLLRQAPVIGGPSTSIPAWYSRMLPSTLLLLRFEPVVAWCVCVCVRARACLGFLLLRASAFHCVSSRQKLSHWHRRATTMSSLIAGCFHLQCTKNESNGRLKQTGFARGILDPTGTCCHYISFFFNSQTSCLSQGRQQHENWR